MFARICLRTQTCRAANRLVQELETKKRVSSYGNARLFLPFLRSVASRDTFSPLVQNRKTSTRKIAMSLSPASDGGLCDATYSCVSFEYVDIASGVRGWRSLGRLASTSSYTCGSQVVRPLSVGDFCQGRELAGGVLRYPPKPEKSLFLPFETAAEGLFSVLCLPAANCVFIIRLVSSRHMTPAIVWRRWP